MEKEEILNLCCEKLALELKRFKIRILKQSPEEIFNKAYLIDTVISLYELSLEELQLMDIQTLRKVLVHPAFLGTMYHLWMQYKDKHIEELQMFIRRALVDFKEKKDRRDNRYKETEQKEVA